MSALTGFYGGQEGKEGSDTSQVMKLRSLSKRIKQSSNDFSERSHRDPAAARTTSSRAQAKERPPTARLTARTSRAPSLLPSSSSIPSVASLTSRTAFQSQQSLATSEEGEAEEGQEGEEEEEAEEEAEPAVEAQPSVDSGWSRAFTSSVTAARSRHAADTAEPFSAAVIRIALPYVLPLSFFFVPSVSQVHQTDPN